MEEQGVQAGYGLAMDEVQAQRVGQGKSPPTLRLYTYAPCALVGRFQCLESELRLDACRRLGIPVNRRPTGGGAIVMGPDQLGVALTLPGAAEDGHRRARELMADFSAGVVAGMAHLGVAARFRGKNDVEIDGKKLAGLGVYRDPSGGLLYHASILVDLDVAYMLSVLSTPFEKITDKAIATVEQRVSTMRREAPEPIGMRDALEAVAAGFAEVFGVQLALDAYTLTEQNDASELRAMRYDTEEWVSQRIATPDHSGLAKRKTAGGLLEVRVTTVGPTIKAVLIGGDFFASDRAVADLEGALRWHPVAEIGRASCRERVSNCV